MKYPSQIIKKHIAFYKKAIERVVNKDSEITDVSIKAGALTNEKGLREQAETIIYGMAANKAYDAVRKELERIRQEYEKFHKHAEQNLQESAEDDRRRDFAIVLSLCERHVLPEIFPRDYSYIRRVGKQDQVIPAPLQNKIMNHPNEESCKHIAFYEQAVERLESKGADIKESLIKAGIWASGNEMGEYGSIEMETTVTNLRYDDFHKEFQAIKKTYHYPAENRSCSLNRYGSSSESRTDKITLSFRLDCRAQGL